ncbi:hypothetical protein EV182_000625, partial [Spiromyces aspiralis]
MANNIDMAMAVTPPHLMNQDNPLETSDCSILEWSPHHGDPRFVVSTGNELRLYLMKKAATLSWSPKLIEDTDVLATGDASGQVTIHRFTESHSSPLPSISRTPRAGRFPKVGNASPPIINLNTQAKDSRTVIFRPNNQSCNTVSFNPTLPQYIAAGFNHARGSESLHIFDISRLFSQQQSSASIDIRDLDTMVSQGANFSCVSVAWLPASQSELIAGSVSSRSASLRLIDLRTPDSGETFWFASINADPASTSRQKYESAPTVYNIRFDPFSDYQFMANDRQSVVRLWDRRWLSDPLYTLNTVVPSGVGLSKASFSRRKRGVISVLARDNTAVQFWDLHGLQEREMRISRWHSEVNNCDQYQQPQQQQQQQQQSTRQLLSEGPEIDCPPQLKDTQPIWAERTSYVISQKRPLSAYTWIPGTVTNSLASPYRMIVCSKDGLLFPLEKQSKHIATMSPLGDVCITNNWEGLCKVTPVTTEQRAQLHGSLVEVRMISPRTMFAPDKTGLIPEIGGSIRDIVPDPFSTSRSVPNSQYTKSAPTQLWVGGANGGNGGQVPPDTTAMGPTNGGLLMRRQQAAIREQRLGAVQNLSDTLTKLKVDTINPAGLGENVSSIAKLALPLMFRAELEPIQDAGATNPDPDYNHFEDSIRSIENQLGLGGDVAHRIHQLTLKGYGMNADLNARLFVNDPELRTVWIWIRDAERAQRFGRYKIGRTRHISFYGVYRVMSLDDETVDKLSVYSTPQRHLGQSASSLSLSRYTEAAHGHSSESGNSGRDGIDADIETKAAGSESSSSRAAAHTHRIFPGSKLNAQRAVALHMCGWDLEGSVLENHLQLLERHGRIESAAKVAFIYGYHARAAESLKRSKNTELLLLALMITNKIDPETGQISMAAPTPLSPNFPDLGIFRNPHISVIITYLASHSWEETLDKAYGLTMAEKLGIALRYLPDAVLMRYLRRTCLESIRSGKLEGLLVAGIQKYGQLLLTNYVDRTTDVQTAALISAFEPYHFSMSSYKAFSAAVIAERWAYAYRTILNWWRMFDQRCMFEISCGDRRVQNGFSRHNFFQVYLMTKPTDVRCNLCHRNIGYFPEPQSHNVDPELFSFAPSVYVSHMVSEGHIRLQNIPSMPSGSSESLSALASSSNATVPTAISKVSASTDNQQQQQPLVYQSTVQQSAMSRSIFTNCPQCHNPLPRCTVCRFTLGTPQPKYDAKSGMYRNNGTDDASFSNCFSWCQTCGHGGHVSHMNEWF